jgi:hypothetical protein
MEDDYRLSFLIPDETFRALENWRRQQNEIPTRAAAARMLLEQMLKEHGYPATVAAARPDPAKAPAAKRKTTTR